MWFRFCVGAASTANRPFALAHCERRVLAGNAARAYLKKRSSGSSTNSTSLSVQTMFPPTSGLAPRKTSPSSPCSAWITTTGVALPLSASRSMAQTGNETACGLLPLGMQKTATPASMSASVALRPRMAGVLRHSATISGPHRSVMRQCS